MKGFIGHGKKLTLCSKCSGESVGFTMGNIGGAGQGLGESNNEFTSGQTSSEICMEYLTVLYTIFNKCLDKINFIASYFLKHKFFCLIPIC